MEETLGTTPPKLRRGNTQSSFRSSHGASYVPSPSADHHYGSLERGFRQAAGAMSAPAPAPTPRPEARRGPKFDLKLDVVMETPVLVVPRHERSFEVLVAHLGQITVRNEVLPDGADRVDRVKIRVTAMNLHSIDLTEKFDEHSDSLHLLSHFRHMTSQELYSSQTEVAVPILHDTAIDLKVDQVSKAPRRGIPESESYSSFLLGDGETLDAPASAVAPSTSLHLHGMVMNPLKVSLYRSQYELLVDSIKALDPEHEAGDRRREATLTRKPSVPSQGRRNMDRLGAFSSHTRQGHA